jgi:hypothetical protein
VGSSDLSAIVNKLKQELQELPSKPDLQQAAIKKHNSRVAEMAFLAILLA